MSLALNSAQQNLAKVIAGKGPDSHAVYEYLVENFSGAEFTLEDLQKDEDLQLLMSPPKASKAKKSSGRGAKTSEERAREGYDPDRCDARVWLNGFGGQCTHKKDEDSCTCQHHSSEGKWGSGLCDEDGNWWLGLVTGSRPENPVRPGGSGKPKAWKMTEDGEAVEKPVKEKKPKMTDEEKEEKIAEKEEKKKEKELEKEEKKKERELKKKEKEEEREFKKALKEEEKAIEKEQKAELSAESEEEMSDMVEGHDEKDLPDQKEIASTLEEVVSKVESEEDISENASDTEETVWAAEEHHSEEYDYLEITFEGVEYQQHKDTGEVIDPEDFSVMGTWNADIKSIDWEGEDAEDQHKCKKSEL